LSPAVRFRRRWQIQCDHFVHGWIIQSQGPSKNLTATAFRPA
jgi:hypothetical protein